MRKICIVIFSVLFDVNLSLRENADYLRVNIEALYPSNVQCVNQVFCIT